MLLLLLLSSHPTELIVCRQNPNFCEREYRMGETGEGFWELTRNPKFQDMLRAEIHSNLVMAGPGNLPYDRMPLLNAFIKETLRIYPAEPFTERMAVQDTVVPLSTGQKIVKIPLMKGEIAMVGIASQWFCRLESRWGEDAHEFRPSRWIDGIVSKGEAIGPYANLSVVFQPDSYEVLMSFAA
ncbi:Cytochrome P450 [Mycena venus]|uniref:Cytochrome P450 n=1 Tax=Mycena venus TaxID=2733690 RepID=A0A8H7DCN0_9AGAR|nr:Cytochrome P450 [Mycena venus]